jgi:hypothetical protein
LKKLVLFLFLCAPGSLFAQESDSLVVPTDSTFIMEDTSYFYNYEDEGDEEDRIAPADSTIVTERPFDPEKLNELKNDDDLQYKEPPTIAESLWDRFLQWLKQIIESIFDNAVSTDWGRVFVYLFGIAVVVVIIMLILKVDAFKVFYAGQGASTVKYNVLDENIHEMDFEQLIREAIDQKDYRRGIRLLFLHALKMLADKHHIQWEQGKTNHDYVAELKAAELRTGFNELSFYFEYAWYGNFTINQELFHKVQNIFTNWKTQVR